jgi:hypothetical protein
MQLEAANPLKRKENGKETTKGCIKEEAIKVEGRWRGGGERK